MKLCSPSGLLGALVLVALLGVVALLSVPAVPVGGNVPSPAASLPREHATAAPTTMIACPHDVLGLLPCTASGSGVTASSTAGPLSPNLTPNSWTETCATCPPGGREAPQGTYDAADGYTVLFGGYDINTGGIYGDTWSYSNGVWTQLFPTISPPARYDGIMAYDRADGYVLLFGGYGASGCLSDTWSFHAGQWTQVNSATSPSARFFPGMTWDGTDNYMILFGGTSCATGGVLGDTWSYLAGQWTQLSPASSPTARGAPGFAWDPSDAETILFGGYVSTVQDLGDTWAWSGGTWTQLSPATAPAARDEQDNQMVSTSNAVFLYGGWSWSSRTVWGDTWEFRGGAWTQLLPATSPPAKGWGMMSYDPSAGVVDFSGYDGTTTPADTWVYLTGPLLSTPVATPATPEVGENVQFNSTLIYAANGPDTFFWTWAPKAWMTCAPSTTLFVNCTGLRTGNYSITVWANDSTGNLGASTLTPFYVAKGPMLSVPKADRILADVGQTVNLTTTLTYSGAGGLSYAWTASGVGMGCPSPNALTVMCLPTAPGSYNVTAWVYDAVGGKGWNTSTQILVSARPSAGSPHASPAASVDVGQSVTFTANVTNVGAGSDAYSWGVSPSGAMLCPVSAGTSITCVTVAAGTVSVTLTVTDSNGGWGSGTLAYQIFALPSLGAPRPSLPSIDVGQSVSFSPVVNGAGSGGLSYAWSASNAGFGCGTPDLSTYNCTPTNGGNYTVGVTATDSNGGQGSALSASYVVFSLPRVSAPSSLTTTPAAGETLNYTSGLLAPGSGGDTYAWTTSSPSMTCTTSALGALWAHCTASKSGSYSVTITVTDSNHGSTSSTSTFLSVTPPLQATATASPTSGDAALQVTFSSSAWGGTAPYHYDWRFGDGTASSSSAPNPSHVYASAGTYQATLWVNDSAGSSVAVSVTVTVNAAATPSGIAVIPGGFTTLGLFLLLAVVVAIGFILLFRRNARIRRELEEAERAAMTAPPPGAGFSNEPRA